MRFACEIDRGSAAGKSTVDRVRTLGLRLGIIGDIEKRRKRDPGQLRLARNADEVGAFPRVVSRDHHEQAEAALDPYTLTHDWHIHVVIDAEK
jgi:hypothetical protein